MYINVQKELAMHRRCLLMTVCYTIAWTSTTMANLKFQKSPKEIWRSSRMLSSWKKFELNQRQLAAVVCGIVSLYHCYHWCFKYGILYFILHFTDGARFTIKSTTLTQKSWTCGRKKSGCKSTILSRELKINGIPTIRGHVVEAHKNDECTRKKWTTLKRLLIYNTLSLPETQN